MSQRGCAAIRRESRWPVGFITEAGMRELRLLLLGRRAMDPTRFAHLRRELGVDLELLQPSEGRSPAPACIFVQNQCEVGVTLAG